MSTAAHDQLSFDWRGLQCPEPILNTARAARKLQGKPAKLTILADDSGFPLDIESWCRTSGARLLKVSTTPEGAYEAVLTLNDASAPQAPAPMPEARKTSIGLRPSPESIALPGAAIASPPQRPTSSKLPAQRSQPAPETSAREILDCRGELCPAPVLKLAAWNRKLKDQEAHLDILADDPAFPLDVESWCRTAQVRLLAIQQEGTAWRASLHKPAAKRLDLNELAQFEGVSADGTLPGLPSSTNPALQRPEPTPTPPASPALHPLPNGSLDTLPGPLKKRAAEPAAASTPAPAPAPALPTSGLSFDLRGMNPTQIDAHLQTLALLDLPGQEVHIQGDDPLLSARIATLARDAGAAITALHTDARGVVATLRLGAPTAPRSAPAAEPSLALATQERPCTLLVLHNDFEALMAALMTANAAAAGGLQVRVFFSFWGVNLLRADRPAPSQGPRPPLLKRLFAWMMPRGPQRQQLGKLNFGGIGTRLLRGFMKKDKIMGVEQLMEAAIDSGVTFVVCTTSMSIMGLRSEDLAPLPNLEYGGVASFVDHARGSSMSLVF